MKSAGLYLRSCATLLGGLLDASLQLSREISQSLLSAGVAAVAILCTEHVMRAGRAEAVMRKLSISVVEDDLFVRESIGRLMRSLGYTVQVFPSAPDFLASPHLDETACLISDVHMPGMSGVELYQRLIDAGRVIPTILVTAYPNDIEQTRALNDGVTCYIRKPLDEQQLICCLRAALGSDDPP